MPLTLQFAVKRIRKTKNCQKGYGCGNSCINKGRKCKKKFSDQASTYAGWLKKNGGGSKSKDSNSLEAKKLTKHLLDGGAIAFKKKDGRTIEAEYIKDKDVNYLKIDDATKKRNLSKRIASELDVENYVNGLFDPKQRAISGDGIPTAKKFGDSYSDRRAKLDKLSNDKAVELIVKHTVDGQMDSELRTSVAELIDKSKKEVIKDVGESVTSTVEKAGMSPSLKRKGDGKNIINPEYRNLTDDLAKEVLANQSKFVKGKRSPSGRLKQEEKRSSKSLQDEIKDFKIDSSDPDTLTLPARLRRGASKVQTGKFFVRLDKLRENKP